jgi:hypothetical protein
MMDGHLADAGATTAAPGGANEEQGDCSAEAFLEIVDNARAQAPELSPLAAAILAALHLEICHDSRTFSRLFGISHALVLREITGLSGDAAPLVTIVSRNARTQRTELALSAAGAQIFA